MPTPQQTEEKEILEKFEVIVCKDCDNELCLMNMCNCKCHFTPLSVSMDREESIRKEFIETMCEKKEDSERFGVYENDGELVSDWWIEKVRSTRLATLTELEERVEGKKKRFASQVSYSTSEMIIRHDVNGAIERIGNELTDQFDSALSQVTAIINELKKKK